MFDISPPPPLPTVWPDTSIQYNVSYVDHFLRLAWALFCCQPTELILGFFFCVINFPFSLTSQRDLADLQDRLINSQTDLSLQVRWRFYSSCYYTIFFPSLSQKSLPPPYSSKYPSFYSIFIKKSTNNSPSIFTPKQLSPSSSPKAQ